MDSPIYEFKYIPFPRFLAKFECRFYILFNKNKFGLCRKRNERILMGKKGNILDKRFKINRRKRKFIKHFDFIKFKKNNFKTKTYHEKSIEKYYSNEVFTNAVFYTFFLKRLIKFQINSTTFKSIFIKLGYL